MRVLGFNWMGVLVEDYQKSVAFFSDTLRLQLEFQPEGREITGFRLPSGQLLEVFGPGNRDYKPKYQHFDGPALGFEVDDIEAARREMVVRGVEFITEIEEVPDDDRWSYFLGPENKLFTILKSKKQKEAKPSTITGFTWAGAVFNDFNGAINFFSDAMEILTGKQDDDEEYAHFYFPEGHLFEVFGPNSEWRKLMPKLTIGFEVADIKSAHEELQRKGVKFLSEITVTPDHAAFAYFRGGDGNNYEIWQQMGFR